MTALIDAALTHGTAAELARILGVDVWTVRHWRRGGTISAAKQTWLRRWNQTPEPIRATFRLWAGIDPIAPNR